METIFCPKCGTQNSSGEASCVQCGFDLTNIQRSHSPAVPTAGVEPPGSPASVPAKKKHSWVGIASFIISILIGIVITLTLLGAGVAEYSSIGGLGDDIYLMIGFFICGGMAVSLLGFILGVVGLFQKEEKDLSHPWDNPQWPDLDAGNFLDDPWGHSCIGELGKIRDSPSASINLCYARNGRRLANPAASKETQI
jgi:hypothetical protein